MPVNYRESVQWLLSFADFERSGRFQDRPDVVPMLALLHVLGDPHLGRRTIHVAGSKGKGSVCAMVESVMRAAGYTTGLYTSPHLHSYTERVQINGQRLTPEGWTRHTASVKRAVAAAKVGLGDRSLVTFDLLTALGFLAFREADVGVQVVEVGLGGRVDSTNVFESKDVAVIAPISLEHTEILGDSVEAIAREKAAIIAPGCFTVMAPQPYPEAADAIADRADAVGARLVEVAAAYTWEIVQADTRRQEVRIRGPGKPVVARLPLLGAHQIANAATAVATIEALRECGAMIPDESVRDGLASVRWPGRMEVLSETPLVIADGAHNRDSARRFRETLAEYFSRDRAFFVVGASAGKDIMGIAEELAPIATGVFAVQANHPRAMEPERIAEAFGALGVEPEVRDSISEAIDVAMEDNAGDGVICVLGSLFVAAETREHFGLARRETI
jgi:dihydrofolate synthase/folylpolyglutamate synthase